MLDRQFGKIVFNCDSCEEVLEGDEDIEFAAVWAEAKRDGWRSKKIGSDWVHGCSKCGV